MKTSNKLLIAFASALILIPIVVIAYAANFRTEPRGIKTAEIVKIGDFATPSKNLTSLPVGAFQSVNLADAKGLVLNIYFIKDEKYGVKIPNSFKDRLSVSVAADGKLQIVIKDSPKGKKGSYYADIYIFAPNTERLNVAKADGIYLQGILDSIDVNVSESGQFVLIDEPSINHITITTTKVNEVRVSNSTIKSLKLNIESALFVTNDASFENLAINSSGTSTLEIGTGDNIAGRKPMSINKLALNTLDSATVNIGTIKINQCTGKFSDQTHISMPAVNLNQMFSVKK